MKKDKVLIIPWAIIGINLVLFVIFMSFLWCSFEYPYVESWGLLLQTLLYSTLPALLAAGYILLYRALRKRLKKWMKIVLTGAVTILILFVSLASLHFMLLMASASPIASKTENSNNYLKLDREVEEFSSLGIFPESIPEEAENMQYFYRYREIIEEDFDIYLKISLPEAEFEAEKTRIIQQYPDAEIVERENGEVEYRIAFEHAGSYHYNFASFSETDSTITYTISYSLEGDTVGDIPYFKEIEKTTEQGN
jgi:hypothetical protein